MVMPRQGGPRSQMARIHPLLDGGGARAASILTVIGLLFALLIPAGLVTAQDNDGSDDAPSTASTPQSGDASPAGQYTVAITEDDIPQSLPSGANLLGRWQLFFETDGTYSVGRADIGVVVTGSYEVDGETITLTDEDGLLSCINAVPAAGPDQPVETATYSWSLDTNGLTLTPITEGCVPRSILLGSRALGFFVACTTTAVILNAGDASEADDASPNATPASADAAEATPGLDEIIPEIDNPFSGDDEADTEDDADADSTDAEGAADISDDEAEAGIDDLLRELSACWSTQDPARIIPLFSADFLDSLVEEAGSLQDVAGIFGQVIVVPINWERSGPVDSDGDVFSAIVALTIGGEESFQRYSFLFEDGTWRLNSFGF